MLKNEKSNFSIKIAQMEFIKKIFLLLILLISVRTNAQSLGIGASFNHTSNGINLYYSNYLGKHNRWSYDAGLRITVNTYSLNKNLQNFIYYQTGYANNFGEHFSINFRSSRKVVAYKWIRLDAMANLHIAYQSQLIKFNNFFRDDNNIIIPIDEVYWKPAMIGELTLGLLLQVAVSSRISITAASGVGICYLNYQYESGRSRTTNKKHSFMRSGLKPNKDRGYYDVVGLDGMPMMSIGLKYKLMK